jgi:vacuolar-type H+-ATPase subunit I/STV1
MQTSRVQLKDYLTKINLINSDRRPDENSTSTIEVYKWFVAKEKAIYNSLNYMRQGNQIFIGYFWCPTHAEGDMRNSLREFNSTEIRRKDNHNIKRPTYLKTNEFTTAF